MFLADIKGDLSGMATPGAAERASCRRGPPRSARTGSATAFPAEFYALGGLGTGVPIRVTITSFGPLLLSQGARPQRRPRSRRLGLVFHYADQAGLPLLDLKDLRAVLSYLVSDEGKAELEGPRRALDGRPPG